MNTIQNIARFKCTILINAYIIVINYIAASVMWMWINEEAAKNKSEVGGLERHLE